MRTRLLSIPLVAALGSFAACGDSGTTTTGSSSSSGSSSSGMTANPCPTVDSTGCTTVVGPSSNDSDMVQTALIETKSNSTVCFCPGTYSFTSQLSLTVPNVTVKGLGKTPDDVTLDFSKDTAGGNDTMLVTADGFTIENLAVKNTPGNGVVVRQADKPTFRKLHVTWDNPDPAKHGAYAVYPSECSNILIEDCESSGAADAAIYVGQGKGAIVRRNKAHDSVLGIELENTDDGEMYDNEVYNNAGGLAVFLLNNLNKKNANRNNVHDNKSHDNNHANFGDKKSVVSAVPPGTGLIVLAADDTEVHNNDFENNGSGAIIVVSNTIFKLLVPGSMPDPKTDPTPDNTFIHDNTFKGNGANPTGAVKMIGLMAPLEDILYDGVVPSGMPTTNAQKFCLGKKGPWPKFRMFAGDHLGDPKAQSTDTTPYQCDLPALPGNMP